MSGAILIRLIVSDSDGDDSKYSITEYICDCESNLLLRSKMIYIDICSIAVILVYSQHIILIDNTLDSITFK